MSPKVSHKKSHAERPPPAGKPGAGRTQQVSGPPTASQAAAGNVDAGGDDDDDDDGHCHCHLGGRGRRAIGADRGAPTC